MHKEWVLVAAITLAACGGSDRESSVIPKPLSNAARQAAVIDEWRIEVSVQPSRLGPIGISSSAPKAAKPNSSHPWIEHDLVFHNRGKSLVHFDDTRTSVVLSSGSQPVLLAADEGCGYAQVSGSGIRAGTCALLLDRFSVPPGASEARTIILWKGLAGMGGLENGQYVFKKTIRSRIGERERLEREIRVIYTIGRA